MRACPCLGSSAQTRSLSANKAMSLQGVSQGLQDSNTCEESTLLATRHVCCLLDTQPRVLMVGGDAFALGLAGKSAVCTAS